MISKHAPRYFISRPLSLIISQLSKYIHLFFLKRVRPERRRVGSLAWDILNSNPPLLRSYYKNENFFFGEWPILRTPTSKEPSRDHQGQVSIIDKTPIIDGGKWPTRTPKCDSWWSWHCGAVDSKSNSLAHPRWRWTGSKPSLVVGFSHISCLMVASLR